MGGLTNLVPARFLCIIAHMVITITILWSRDANIKACLPASYDQAAYNSADSSLLAALILTLIFIVMELCGFMAGITMFVNADSLLCTCAHASACIALSFFLFEVWPCNIYWFVFAGCSAIPALVDTAVIISKLCFTRTS